MTQDLVSVVVTLIVVGVLLWAVTTFIPLAPPIRQIITVVVVVAVICWLIQVFGLLAYVPRGVRRL